jgi:hypothetical protein
MLEEDFDEDGEEVYAPGYWGIDMTIHEDGLETPGGGATGDYSFAAGLNNTSGGKASAVFGTENSTSGIGSAAFGEGNSADAHSSFAIGRFNIGGGSPTSWIETDPIFEIGNGINSSSLSNVLTILKNGTITAPSLTNTLIDLAGDKALITKEYALSVVGSSGLQRIEIGGGGLLNPAGWILDKNGEYLDGGDITGPGNWAIDMMIHEDYLDSDGTASQSTGASGLYSFGAGRDNAVLGNYSAGFGGYNAIEGIGSAVFGFNNWAFGNYSLVQGNANRTTGDYISAFGQNLKADASHSIVMGRYNVGGGTASSWVATEPILEIGNGTADASRSNALTVLKSGKTTVNESTPSSIVHAINGVKTHTGLNDAAGVYGENTVGTGFGFGVLGLGNYRGVVGRSELQGVRGEAISTNGGTHQGVFGIASGANTGINYGVYGFAFNGATNYAVYASGDLAYTGALINASDRKLKTNINSVSNALTSILELKPSTYKIAPEYVKSMNMSNKPQFGFIAQELQEVFPDLVSVNKHSGVNREDDTTIEYLGVNYTALIPILTAGMQEQQKQIETQQELIEKLITRIEVLEEN